MPIPQINLAPLSAALRQRKKKRFIDRPITEIIQEIFDKPKAVPGTRPAIQAIGGLEPGVQAPISQAVAPPPGSPEFIGPLQDVAPVTRYPTRPIAFEPPIPETRAIPEARMDMPTLSSIVDPSPPAQFRPLSESFEQSLLGRIQGEVGTSFVGRGISEALSPERKTDTMAMLATIAQAFSQPGSAPYGIGAAFMQAVEGTRYQDALNQALARASGQEAPPPTSFSLANLSPANLSQALRLGLEERDIASIEKLREAQGIRALAPVTALRGQVISVGGKMRLINMDTGETIRDLGPVTDTKGIESALGLNAAMLKFIDETVLPKYINIARDEFFKDKEPSAKELNELLASMRDSVTGGVNKIRVMSLLNPEQRAQYLTDAYRVGQGVAGGELPSGAALDIMQADRAAPTALTEIPQGFVDITSRVGSMPRGAVSVHQDPNDSSNVLVLFKDGTIERWK